METSQPNATRMFVVVIPFVCFLVVVGIAAYEWSRVREYEALHSQLETNIATIDREQQRIEQQVATPHVPSVPATPDEQPTYLNTLRSLADAAKVKLVKWTNAPTFAGAPEQSSNTPVLSTMPKDVTPLESTVEVAGPYTGVRQFMYSLTRSPRLYNIGNAKWMRDDKWPLTTASFILVRYVTPPSANVAQQPTGSPVPSNSTTGGIQNKG